MTYLLIISFLIMIAINYFGCGMDFFNPGVIFSFMNLINAIICGVAVNAYGIEMHFSTVVVLVGGCIVFSIVNVFVYNLLRIKHRTNYNTFNESQLSNIYINKFWILFLIAFELLVWFYMIRYTQNVVKAYYGSTYDLATNIGMYNRVVKNHGEELRQLRISAGAVYTYGWPLCHLICVFIGAVVVNNYILSKKINKYYLIPILLPIVMSFFTGSRSLAFRFITAFIAEYIIIYRYHTRSYRKGNAKILIRLIFIAVVVAFSMLMVIRLMGRGNSIDPFQYFVAYLGGPFINLDMYLQNTYHSSFFGQETFNYFYAYIGARFGIDSLRNSLYIPYIYWNGIYLGNVYTMYYMFIEDFGYWGIVPLTAIIALFYSIMYTKLMNFNIRRSIVSPRLLIFAYLFNDIIMMTFSNRFYENVLRPSTIRIYAWIVVFWFFYRRGLFRPYLLVRGGTAKIRR